jgi:DNA-binding beta-propeller fold protein YncE
VSTRAGGNGAGFADGPQASAVFNAPAGLARGLGGLLLLTDSNGHRIRAVYPGGAVSNLAGSGSATFADGTGISARFNAPWGVVADPGTGTAYVADKNNCRIRSVSPGGTVFTIGGTATCTFQDGTGTASTRFNAPEGITLDAAAGMLYIADTNNHRIRTLVIATQVVATLAGSGSSFFLDGLGAAASFSFRTIGVTGIAIS